MKSEETQIGKRMKNEQTEQLIAFDNTIARICWMGVE